MRRDWTAAHEKLDQEGRRCRVCRSSPVDAAHLVARSRVGPPRGEDPRNIVGLCREHHQAFDSGGLDLLPYLSLAEQGYVAELVGLVEGLRRMTNQR
jgi:predicted restriction endonuclease